MTKRKQKRTSIRQKVCNTLRRLGMQAQAGEVVVALAKYGVSVSEGFVERVRIEELKGRERVGKVSAQTSNRVRKRQRMQKIPQKRPWRK
jgi:hypothetical protein